MSKENTSHIPGYRFGDAELPPSQVTIEQFREMQEAALFGEDDVAALRRSGPILEPKTSDILDVWYGFVGSKSFLLAHFSEVDGPPIADYLGRVRARFGQWIQDTATAEYDETWLAWQLEIGRRHHRVGKNRTDGAASTALVPFRFLAPLCQPIVDTLRPFLEGDGRSRSDVDAMQNAWRKSALLQVTLWSHPYVIAGDY